MPKSKKKKLLVIDDEDAICRMLKINLEDTGKFEVDISTKGSKALKLALDNEPDLVILDYLMPDMDGSEVAFQLLNNDKTKDIPIIFLTAIATKEDNRQQGDKIGGITVLAKPIKLNELLSTINESLT